MGSTRATVIGARKVMGTAVKDNAGQLLGEIHEIVLEEVSNNIRYAVLTFEGVSGRSKYHPLPWSMLRYDTSDGTFVVNVTRDQLNLAPADSAEEVLRNDGLAFRDCAYTYYYARGNWQG